MKSFLSRTMLEHERIDDNWRALRGPRAIVEVVEAAAETLIENGRSTKRKRTIIANREASSNDSAGLRRSIKLKLIIGGDVACAATLVFEDTILERNGKRTGLFAVHYGVTVLSPAGWRCDSA